MVFSGFAGSLFADMKHMHGPTNHRLQSSKRPKHTYCEVHKYMLHMLQEPSTPREISAIIVSYAKFAITAVSECKYETQVEKPQ